MVDIIPSSQDLQYPLPPAEEAPLEEVFRLVRERAGIDLRAYRRKTIERRMFSRLQKVRCQTIQEYVAHLANDPDETQRLVEHVTIKVSRFFRDARVYARLRDEVLPNLFRTIAPFGEVRIWSAGCGNGEEPYSLSILVEEMAKPGHAAPKVAIWGTDLDEGALSNARRGLYAESSLAESPPDLASAYFTCQQGRFGPQYELIGSPRPRVRFLRHDLLSAASVPGGLPFHLALCRNVLIYFERPAQEQAFRLLAGSLAPGGYLCLGEAEQLPKEHQAEFDTVDRQARLYRKHSPKWEGEGNHAAK